MKKTNSKVNSRVWLTVVGTLAAALVIVLLVIVPLYRTIADLRAELDTSEQAVAEAEQEVKNYQAAVAEFRRIESGRRKITAMFPEREEMVSLVLGLEQAVIEAGGGSDLKLTDEIENPPPKAAGANEKDKPKNSVEGLSGIQEIPYRLTLNSSYRDLVDFMLGFENLPFVSSLGKIAVTADTEQNQITETLINTGTGTTLVEGLFFIRAPGE